MRIRLGLAIALLAATAASAQTQPDRLRVEFQTGVLFQGSLADAAFVLDTTPFGGTVIERGGGSLDVDPSLSFGLRTTYRIAERLQIVGAWMHSEGRYRVQFPALATEEGDFDLEALILAGFDFQLGPNARAASAMSVAKSDFYSAGVEYDLPILQRRFFPYAVVTGGIFTQKSDGDVIQLEFQGDVPAGNRLQALIAGGTGLESAGLSVFQIDSSDLLVTVGGGIRASLGGKWGAHLSVTDMIRLNADLSDLNAESTPPPDAASFRLYQTTWDGTEGLIHNFGVQLALSYAAWPYGAPR